MFSNMKIVAANASRRVATVKPVSSTARRYSSTMHDNDPEVLESEKNKNITNTQHKTSTPHDHAPGWNEHLASASEAAIKADGHEGSLDEMKSNTIKYVQNRHSPDAQSMEASYSQETVKGPLGKVPIDRLVERNVLKEEVVDKFIPTPSEEAVKADRGEI